MRGSSNTSFLRRLSAAVGILALIALGFTPEGALADRIALAAFGAICVATALCWSQLVIRGRPVTTPEDQRNGGTSRAWAIVTACVVVFAGLAVQSWFKPGTTIATGDIGPVEGTAWLSRIFVPWAWTGSNLGEPSQLPMDLPWAVVLGTVNTLGGSPASAQRIWYTLLFVGASLSAVGLMAALRMGPIPALIGATVYMLNPYVVSGVNMYAVYLVAMGLLAGMPAALIAVGTGRLSIGRGALLVAVSAPFLGYVFYNPPLLGTVLGVVLATPPLLAWVEGKGAALRSLRALALAVLPLLALSAYWIVPAVLHLTGAGAASHLASLSTWAWTEGRATLRNAFWLNAHWGWTYPIYFPYAPAYDALPLSLTRFVLPAVAFGALGLGYLAQDDRQRVTRDRAMRLVVAAATVALTVTFLSTGTNPPGNLIFDRLYNLPFGWLLREPGRFLMVVALAYAVLIAVIGQMLLSHTSVTALKGLRGAAIASLRSSTTAVLLAKATARFAFVPFVLAIAIGLGFPIYTGVIVPDHRPSLPPAHVRMPAYWAEMAQFVDGLPTQGSLLVMPPDDFYQMPYTWGYYGTDAFVVESFHRHVLVPNEQGYTPTLAAVTRAVNMTAQTILKREWRQTEILVRALNAPLILVRRDINATFAGRSIVVPNDLATSLDAAPNFVLLRRFEALELFALVGSTSETELETHFVTMTTRTPDLRILSQFPASTAIVAGEPQAGIPSIMEAPPLEGWQFKGNDLVWQPNTSPRGAYRIADLGSNTSVPLVHAGAFSIGALAARVNYDPSATTNAITVLVSGRSAISNGDFTRGLWGPVGDCHAITKPAPVLGASIDANGAPEGLPALRLSASLDSACEDQSLDWRGGALVMSLMTHPVLGAAPRICLWEVGPHRCATIPPIPAKEGWSEYRVSLRPDPGTVALALFLYADNPVPGGRTISEYANVHVTEVSALPTLDLVSEPASQSIPLQLVVDHNSFSDHWQGSVSGKHVLVDGMLNGWLVATDAHGFTATYGPTSVVRAASWISVGALVAISLVLILMRSRVRLSVGVSRMS